MKFPKIDARTAARRHSQGRSLAGQSLALVPLCVGLLFGGLALPRGVPPEGPPAPEVDVQVLARVASDDDIRAARVRAAPLPSPVRAVGSGFRAFNLAEAHHADENDIAKTRDAIYRAVLGTSAEDTEALLDLRAFQLNHFLSALGAFEQTGQVSAELEEYGGTFVERMKKVGWYQEPRVVMSDAVRRAAFKLMWNRALLLDGEPRFALQLDELRELYGFYLTHPHPSENDRSRVDALRGAARDKATCERAQVALEKATGSWLIGKVAELEKLDPAYPALLARAAGLYMMRDYTGAASTYEAWLEAHPSGPWTLRVRNHLRAALLAAERVLD
jgi:hypothetical protein